MEKEPKDRLKIFNTTGDLFSYAARMIADTSKKSVKEKGRFSLCISGGNTPLDLYRLLSGDKWKNEIDWKHTFVFWADERCVAEDDLQNNSFNARSVLLTKVPIPESSIFTVPVHFTPVEAALKYEESLHIFFGNEKPRFDLVLLGLGPDGHTASLFPGSEILNEQIRWVRETYVDEMHMYRVTLTTVILNQARRIVFLVTGEEKRAILHKVLHSPFDPINLPAQLIKPENGELLWLTDNTSQFTLRTQDVAL